MRSINRILVIGIALASVAIYLYTAAPFMLWQDAPQFLASIITVGFGQPAEPVYVLLAHFFTYLPFGSVLFRIQLFSALLAGCSLLLLYRLVVHILEQPNSTRKKHFQPYKQSTLLLAGIFSMLTLAFSYQFWSQAQNVETFILDCFIELVILNLLLSKVSYKNVFSIMAVSTVLCGIATGTDPPVVATVFPTLFVSIWKWRKGLEKKRLAILIFLGLSSIALAWIYLPFRANHQLLLSRTDYSTLTGIWDVATGQGLNVNAPSISQVNGFTWSLQVLATSAWHYLMMVWMDFTPLLLPFIIFGAVYLWQKQRRTLFLLSLIAITNFLLSCLYLSGNQESWYLQSDVIFAIFAGMSYAWLVEVITPHMPKLTLRIAQAGLFILVLIPLVYWWPTLDRHRWYIMQDYINNLYDPIQGPAIVLGIGDFWDSVSTYMYDATNYKHDVVPVIDNFLYTSEWYRKTLALKSHVKLPDRSYIKNGNPIDYSRFMNAFIADNIGKFHFYITQPSLTITLFPGSTTPSLKIDQNKFALVPVGMTEEIVPKNDNLPSVEQDSFSYHYTNDFPRSKPYFLEHTYSGELDDVIQEIALSYSSVGEYLMNEGKYQEASTFLHKAYALDPRNTLFLEDLGLLSFRQGQFSTALDYFIKVHTSKPDYLNGLYNIALTEAQLGEFEQAKRDFTSVIDSSKSDAEYKQLATKQLDSLNAQYVGPGRGMQPRQDPSQSELNVFSNAMMNLTFIYPKMLRLTQVNSKLLSIAVPENSNSEDELLIYTSEVSDWNASKLYVPFTNLGQFQNSTPVQQPNFQGTMEIFLNKGNAVLLLLLRNGHELVAVRFPEHATIDPQIVRAIISSMKKLH